MNFRRNQIRAAVENCWRQCPGLGGVVLGVPGRQGVEGNFCRSGWKIRGAALLSTIEVKHAAVIVEHLHFHSSDVDGVLNVESAPKISARELVAGRRVECRVRIVSDHRAFVVITKAKFRSANLPVRIFRKCIRPPCGAEIAVRGDHRIKVMPAL